MNTLLRRTSALAATALVAGAISLPAGSARAATSTTSSATPSASAAAWLAAQAKDGVIENGYLADPTKPTRWTTFPDYGTTADALISFAAADVHPSDAGQMLAALSSDATVASWTTGADFSSADVYAGSTAKALVVSQLGGGAGDAKLVSQLEGTVQPSGRLQDTVDPNNDGADYANTIGQAFAAQGLSAAGSTKSAAVTDFLLDQQCTGTGEGFFRLYFKDAAGANADTTCDSEAGAVPDTDVTAYAILTLLAQQDDPAVKTAIDKAAAWLASTQKADGSFIGSSASTATANANSTGLAGWALGATGDTTDAAEAAAWIRAHQVVDGPDAGAIAYDDSYLAGLTCTGIAQADSGYWLSATAQALPVLAYLADPAIPGAKTPACPPVAHPTTVKQLKSAKGVVKLKVTKKGKPFTGTVKVKAGKKKIVTKARKGIVKLKAAKVLGHKKKVRAILVIKGGRASVLIKKR